ncbi:hypothetical protein [Thermoactinomyces sp. DSM 45892]|uniref:hypothetical protein n=1 Tax=Thermoactinomyces sp. DSM 45892 TaxID=1882753 RepID=UPI0008982E05|nr:hypothetical protein [Thermoactinomyces sp. DSM 45892]SDY88646.1 hypothetical protein SAMN05444416_109172 [Thermoactinomyces sp. DSM 45892]
MSLSYAQQQLEGSYSLTATPFKWKVAEKVQPRSGRGFYDYVNPTSAKHILLLEDMQIGRIKREYGDFLCGKVQINRKLHDLMHLNDIAVTEREIEKSKQQRITCKKCLELVERFSI